MTDKEVRIQQEIKDYQTAITPLQRLINEMYLAAPISGVLNKDGVSFEVLFTEHEKKTIDKIQSIMNEIRLQTEKSINYINNQTI